MSHYAASKTHVNAFCLRDTTDFLTDMTDNLRENRIKRLYYQSWHRGCKETDLLLGRFANAALPTLNDSELDAYEALLAEEDSTIWKWFSNELPLAPEHNNRIWQLLVEINQKAVNKN
jgi:antitoxin CptB